MMNCPIQERNRSRISDWDCDKQRNCEILVTDVAETEEVLDVCSSLIFKKLKDVSERCIRAI